MPPTSVNEVAILPPLPLLNGAEARHVTGFPGYAVSSDGRIFSCKLPGPLHTYGETWRQLAVQLVGKPSLKYPTAGLSNGRKDAKRLYVHRLVLREFVGPAPDGMEACHIDGNPLNARLDNLRWDTPSNNNRDKERHGTMTRGRNIKNAKLFPCDVRQIRAALAIGPRGTQARIARDRGISQSVVSEIGSGVAWSHVTDTADK